MADIMAWEVHERLRDDLMSTLARQQPPGYAQVGVAQIRRADEVCFTILARLAQSGIKRKEGERPLDKLLMEAMNHRDYNLALQPLPGAGAPKRDFAEAGGASSSGTSSRNQRRRESKKTKLVEIQTQVAQLKGQKGQAQNKGNGKGKNSSKGDKGQRGLPMSLRMPGFTATDEQGNPICFGFNLEGCSGAAPGGTCSKGRHICMKSSCRQPHPASTYHK